MVLIGNDRMYTEKIFGLIFQKFFNKSLEKLVYFFKNGVQLH